MKKESIYKTYKQYIAAIRKIDKVIFREISKNDIIEVHHIDKVIKVKVINFYGYSETDERLLQVKNIITGEIMDVSFFNIVAAILGSGVPK